MNIFNIQIFHGLVWFYLLQFSELELIVTVVSGVMSIQRTVSIAGKGAGRNYVAQF